MTQLKEVGRRQARIPRAAVLAPGIACLAIASLVHGPGIAAGQCTPAWDDNFVTTGLSIGGSVSAFVTFDDGSGESLYAAGSFFNVDGQPANGFMRWDTGSNTWTPRGVGTTDGQINALAVVDDGSGSAIYAAGAFSTIGGVSASQVARYDHVNDTWQPVGSGLNFTQPIGARDLVAWGSNLYAIGNSMIFTTQVGDVNQWDGAQWTSIRLSTTGANLQLSTANAGAVFTYADEGEQLFVGGIMSGFGGAVSRWNGESWVLAVTTSPGFQVGTQVLSLGVAGGDLYAGSFCPNGSHIGQCVRRWDGLLTWSTTIGSNPLNVQLLTPFNPGPAVRALAAGPDPGGTGPSLFAAGQLISHDPPTRAIARFDGSNWWPMSIGVYSTSGAAQTPTGVATGVHVFDDGSGPAVYVGGEFNFAENDDGQGNFSSRGIARWGCFDDAPPSLADPATSQLLASNTVISSFGGQTSITVVPRDAANELLGAGRDVTISATAGDLLGAVADLGDGTYFQDLQAVPGPSVALVSAVVDGVAIDATALITFVPVDPVQSDITLSTPYTFEGGSAVVTVTPADDNGDPVGAGFDVAIATTHGVLLGAVSDNGDGTYSQTIFADAAGTANITATVDGLPLDTSASLSVLDPGTIGDIIGDDGSGTLVGFMSIQEAVDAGVATIYIVPRLYEETIQIDGGSGLTLEGLGPDASGTSATIRGAVISDSDDVRLVNLVIDATGGPHDALVIRGGPRASSGVEIIGCTVTGAAKSGIVIDRGNEDVLIQDSTITGNGRNGVEAHLTGGHYTLLGNTISGNGWNGVSIGRDVVITLIENHITGNGTAGGQGGGRWGIDRQRKPQGGDPEQVTLIQNVIEDNNGSTKAGSADQNINNYDQIIDGTDDQPPYTS